MPASRILEGRLTQQHPTRRYSWRRNQNSQRSRRGISRAKPVASWWSNDRIAFGNKCPAFLSRLCVIKPTLVTSRLLVQQENSTPGAVLVEFGLLSGARCRFRLRSWWGG